jgi:hypothetical protein
VHRGAAFQQLGAGLVFQFLDVRRHIGLHGVQQLGSGTEAADSHTASNMRRDLSCMATPSEKDASHHFESLDMTQCPYALHHWFPAGTQCRLSLKAPA